MCVLLSLLCRFSVTDSSFLIQGYCKLDSNYISTVILMIIILLHPKILFLKDSILHDNDTEVFLC